MGESNFFRIPLSPPISPRMSSYHTDPGEPSWRDLHNRQFEGTPDSTDGRMALTHAETPSLDISLRPILRSHKTFPYTLRTTGSSLRCPASRADGLSDSPAIVHRHGSIEMHEIAQSNGPSAITFGGSAPSSPTTGVIPASPHQEPSEHTEPEPQDLNGIVIAADEPDERLEAPPRQLTAAEIRNQKRKMKRFRLTHNQTRFLMSEFARQAHPDAAHRERLAREIPGLSARQVQVWFQNRRAKLKRLTSDDRERMMRSRALPDDFDMTQALHSPFGTTHSGGSALSTSTPTPITYSPAFPEGNMMRSLNIDKLRRVSESPHASPANVTPSFSGFNFTPPQSVTDTSSPMTPASDSPFHYSPTFDSNSRSANRFITNTSSPSPYTSHPQLPKPQLNERSSRSESISSPLRTSISYVGSGDHCNGHFNQNLDGTSLVRDSSSARNGLISYGLGLSYPNLSSLTPPPSSRMRSFPNMSRRIEIGNAGYQQSAAGHSLQTPQTATFPSYVAAPLTPGYSMMSAPHSITSFPNSYMKQDQSSGAEGYTLVKSITGDGPHQGHKCHSDGSDRPPF